MSQALKPLPRPGDLHGGPFGRRDRAPAVGAAPALARTCSPDPPDASPGPPEHKVDVDSQGVWRTRS